jgi:hypothetical protein
MAAHAQWLAVHWVGTVTLTIFYSSTGQPVGYILEHHSRSRVAVALSRTHACAACVEHPALQVGFAVFNLLVNCMFIRPGSEATALPGVRHLRYISAMDYALQV